MENMQFEVVDPASPLRCQGVGATGQCKYKRQEGSNYCPRHGANSSQMSTDKKAYKTYQLKIWQEKLDHYHDDPNIKSLRCEIGILRMTLTAILDKCENETQLLIHSSRIADLATRLEKLVSSADRLEMKMSMFLDKSAAINFAGQIVDIIASRVSDTAVVDDISSEIIKALASLTESRDPKSNTQ